MAVLADEANVSQEGKLNLMGIFDRIGAAEFPVAHPKMVFAFQVEAEFTDTGRMIPLRVSLEDDEGGEMMGPPVAPGEHSTSNQLFTLVGVQFPRPGRYRFVVQVGDAPPHETPLLVQQHAAPADSTLN
jgi:hypothetical protein